MDSTLPISSAIPPISTNEVGTVETAKVLIIRALHKTLMDVNLAAERVSQQFLGTSNINANSNAADDKRIMAPQSMNPLSVTNPQSMLNPMSVNTPNSVKSISDEKISSNQMNDSLDVTGNPLDVYNNSINNFLNTCDEIEKNLQVITEVNRRMQRFEGKSLLQSNKSSLTNGLQRMTQIQNRVRSNATMKRPAAIIIPEDFDDLGKKKLRENNDKQLVADDFKIEFKI